MSMPVLQYTPPNYSEEEKKLMASILREEDMESYDVFVNRWIDDGPGTVETDKQFVFCTYIDTKKVEYKGEDIRQINIFVAPYNTWTLWDFCLTETVEMQNAFKKAITSNLPAKYNEYKGKTHFNCFIVFDERLHKSFQNYVIDFHFCCTRWTHVSMYSKRRQIIENILLPSFNAGKTNTNATANISKSNDTKHELKLGFIFPQPGYLEQYGGYIPTDFAVFKKVKDVITRDDEQDSTLEDSIYETYKTFYQQYYNRRHQKDRYGDFIIVKPNANTGGGKKKQPSKMRKGATKAKKVNSAKKK